MNSSVLNEIISYVIAIGMIAAIWALFFKIGSSVTKVEISEGLMVFKTKKSQISLKPLLDISKIRKRNRLLSVGQEFNSSEPTIKVDLLNYKGEAGGTKEYLLKCN